MPRLIWFVLKDGRSVVGSCDGLTRETLDRALTEPERFVTLTADDAVDRLRAGDIRDFVLFDSRMSLPANTSIYHFVVL